MWRHPPAPYPDHCEACERASHSFPARSVAERFPLPGGNKCVLHYGFCCKYKYKHKPKLVRAMHS